MQAPQSLRRPSNWQDFETLCKKLWGEIWNCAEIQKNGRSGQNQYGVDIFGMPEGQDGYYGIQCKGKDEYTDAQFTESEIEAEINKAKAFEPALKKYFLATTAVNDAKIQAFVRKKNLEHKANNLFEVHLFCWETIVDLIEENRSTYNYYVKSQNYKTDQKVAISFGNGESHLVIKPRFLNYYEVPNGRIELYIEEEKADTITSYARNFLPPLPVPKSKVNYSYCPMVFTIRNTGNASIEDYKVFLEFQGDIQDLSDSNIVSPLSTFKQVKNCILNFNEPNGVEIIPLKNKLVGDDVLLTNEIFVKPTPKEATIGVKWKLIAKDFKDEGELFIQVLPSIERIQRDYSLVYPSDYLGNEDGIEDCII